MLVTDACYSCLSRLLATDAYHRRLVQMLYTGVCDRCLSWTLVTDACQLSLVLVTSVDRGCSFTDASLDSFRRCVERFFSSDASF